MRPRFPSFARSIVAVVVLALAGGGCVAPAIADDAVPARRRTVMLQGGFLQVDVEAPIDPPGPKPAVVSYLEAARATLLAAGFVVVTYTVHWEMLRGLAPPAPAPAPAPAPGSPKPAAAKPVGKWLLASPTPKTIGQGYLGLIDATARGTLPEVLDVLASDPDVDPGRIGIAGFSTNGFMALHATSVDPRFRVAVAVAACGDYHRFLHRSTLAMAGARLDLDPTYEAWLRRVEPARHPERLVHAAVLMVNGRDDLPIPLACAQSTALALRSAYRYAGAPERFRFVVIDEGHALGERGRHEAVAWLSRWLQPARSAP